MAIGKKTGGRNFKKGTSGNPKGRRKGIDEPAAVVQRPRIAITKELLARYNEEFSHMTTAELKAIDNNPRTPHFQRMVIQAMLGKGHNALDFILDRTIGRVKNEVEVTRVNRFADWTDAQLEAKRKQLEIENSKTIKQLEDQRVKDARKVIDLVPKDVTPVDDTEGTTTKSS